MLQEMAHRIWAGDWPITGLLFLLPWLIVICVPSAPEQLSELHGTLLPLLVPLSISLDISLLFHAHLQTIFLTSFPQFWTMLLQLFFHCFLFSVIPLTYNVAHWCSVKLLFIVPRWTDFWLEKNRCTYMQPIRPFTGRVEHPAGQLILAPSHFPSNTGKPAALHS